jgi:hypothetical protein
VKLEEIKIYRITHIKNIPHILDYGITHKNSPNCNPNFVNIGDLSLIDTRSSRNVIVDNGNFSNKGARAIVLGEFIPFYFGVKMPMLYVIQNGGNFVEKATHPKDIVYLSCPVHKIVDFGYTYYFSDGHATDNLTTFYDSTQIHNLPNIINWEAIKAPYWGGHDNLNLKRKKQAEFLISDDIDPRCLINIGCYSETSKDTLFNMGVDPSIIKIVPYTYY